MSIVSAILVLILASSTARFLEERYYPVYENVETVAIDGYGSSASVLFRGVRTRDCEIVRVRADVDGAHVWAEILVQERGDLPTLLHGNFRFVLVIRVPAGRLQELEVMSSCHPLWVTRQDLLKNE